MAEDSTVPYTVMFNNFESTVGSRAPAWSALDIEGSTSTAATVSFATTDVRTRVSHARSLRVTNRDAAADGTQMTIPTTLLTAGQAYTISAWVYVDPAAVLFNPANPVQARVRAGTTL
ncbi:MAG TPA: carbohydrate binding domain-containing protein, partial [Actinotalea sp.]|nr:carbohydrate binding domain-containing protein [Actinotalea sp.]